MLDSTQVACPASPAPQRTAAVVNRDPELETVLLDLEQRLEEIAPIRGRGYDEKLAALEALAAPYAMAFLHEIRRLDALVVEYLQAKRSEEAAAPDGTCGAT